MFLELKNGDWSAFLSGIVQGGTIVDKNGNDDVVRPLWGSPGAVKRPPQNSTTGGNRFWKMVSGRVTSKSFCWLRDMVHNFHGKQSGSCCGPTKPLFTCFSTVQFLINSGTFLETLW